MHNFSKVVITNNEKTKMKEYIFVKNIIIIFFWVSVQYNRLLAYLHETRGEGLGTVVNVCILLEQILMLFAPRSVYQLFEPLHSD